MSHPIAYIPLNTYPDAPSDDSVLATLSMARRLGCTAHVALFSVEIPLVVSPIGGVFINAEGMARAAEEKSKAESARLRAQVQAADARAEIAEHQPVLGGVLDQATAEARYLDLALVPWSADSIGASDMAEALIFGTGLPVVLVPRAAAAAAAGDGRMDHIAIAWDESRVAARALGDALRLLLPGGKVTVLTVQGEKPLRGPGIAETLASALSARGYRARAVSLPLGGKSIGTALQDAALAEGAQLLAMGGFGHSRLRDFVLGGATKGVLSDLRLPVLLAH